MGDETPDKIGEAIEVAETQEQHRQVNLTLASTQRHVVLSFPVDATEAELLDILGWIATEGRRLAAEHRAMRNPVSRILVPVGTQRPS